MQKSNMQIDEMLLAALRAHLSGEKIEWKEVHTEEWLALFQLAAEQSVLPMVFDAVYNCRAAVSIPEDLMQNLHFSVREQVVAQMRKTAEVSALYPQMLEAGLQPLVVKGIMCRSQYPNPDYRLSNDEDFLIRWEEFDRADQAMRSWGMAQQDEQKDGQTEFEVTYFNPDGCLVVELHKDFFAEDSDAYGDFNQLFRDVHETKIVEEIDGCKFYTLNHTDHLVYLIAHAFKHFLHSGFGIRQVCDVAIFAEMHEADINWEIVAEKCEKIRALYFAAALFEIGRTQMGRGPRGLQQNPKWQQLVIDPADLLKDLLAGGVYGGNNLTRKRSSTITLGAVAAEKQGKEAQVSLRKTLFPPARDIAGRYPYLNKFPFLLPFAWLDRIFHYYKECRKSDGNQAGESMELGKQRVELLRKYKVID